MTQIFRSLSSSSARTRLTTRAMRRCSAAPALALTAAGLRGAERRSVSMTPSTPAPSATRSSAPRFCGSSTPSRARSSRRAAGFAEAESGAKRSSMERKSWGRTRATTPWWAAVWASQGQLLARLLADADAGLAAERRRGARALVVRARGRPEPDRSGAGRP